MFLGSVFSGRVLACRLCMLGGGLGGCRVFSRGRWLVSLFDAVRGGSGEDGSGNQEQRAGADRRNCEDSRDLVH
jgi:hypothetical protein